MCIETPLAFSMFSGVASPSTFNKTPTFPPKWIYVSTKPVVST